MSYRKAPTASTIGPQHTDTVSDLEYIPWSIWGQAVIIVLGAFSSMLSSTIVNLALAAIASDLDASPTATQWIATGYLLALSAGVPLSSWAAKRIGSTRLWMGSLALFSVFSIWCALSTTLPVLVVGRVLQGLAGGLLVPAGQTILAVVAGRGRLGRIMSVVGIAIVVAPTLGTTLGSVVLDRLGWTSVFLINVPLGAVALIAGALWLPKVQAGIAGRLDWFGLLLVMTGVPLLIYGVSAAGKGGGLGRVHDMVSLAAGAALLVLFLLWTLRVGEPVLNLKLFTSSRFSLAAGIIFVGGALNFGALLLLPYYFVDVRGETSAAAGLLIAPQIVGTAIGFPFAGRISDRYGSGLLLLGGGMLTVLATLPLALVAPDSSYWWLGAVLLVRGFGMALCTIPAMTAGLARIGSAEIPDAMAILNMLQRTGASVGIALVAILYGANTSSGLTVEGFASAFTHAAWWLFAGALLLSLLSAFYRRAERGGS